MARELQCIILLFCLIKVSDTRRVTNDCGITKTKYCPNFDRTSWEERTKHCCGNNGTFHCQESESGPIFTCHDFVVCEKGTFANLSYVNSDNVAIECLPCQKGYFEPSAKESFQFRYPHCKNSIQLCQEEDKLLVFAGNASHDGLCTCNWKNGWSSKLSQCLDPSGFPGNSACSCEQHSCPDGSRLNSSFKCSPLEFDTTLTKSPARFTEMKIPFSGFDQLPTKTTSTVDTAVSDWNRDDGIWQKTATISSIVIFTVLACIGAFCCWVYAKRRQLRADGEDEESSRSLNTSDDQSGDSVHIENEGTKFPLNTSNDQSGDSVHK